MGLEPWPEGVTQIECVTVDQAYDLHNFAGFAGLEWDPVGRLTLTFEVDDERRPPPVRVSLVFEDVRNLSLLQAPDFATESSADLDEWTYREVGDGRGEVRFDFPDLAVALTARSVTLVVVPSE